MERFNLISYCQKRQSTLGQVQRLEGEVTVATTDGCEGEEGMQIQDTFRKSAMELAIELCT